MKTLARYGLRNNARQKFETLSGGQKARLEILRLEIEGHNVLLLDEPLTGLDAELHDRLLSDISTMLASLRTTVVHVTHDMVEASALSTRIVHIGQLDADSVTPSEADHG